MADSRIKVVLGKEEGDKALHLEIPVIQKTDAVEVEQQTTATPVTDTSQKVESENVLPVKTEEKTDGVGQ